MEISTFQPTNNINVRLGYYGNYGQGLNWNSFNSLLNSDNNSFSKNSYTARTYLQFTQTFKNDNKDEEAKKKHLKY